MRSMRSTKDQAATPRVRCGEKRSGATIVEFAVVAPIAFLLVIGLVVGGTGVFRYQEVAHLAREATRYASTHGGSYAADGLPGSTGVAAISSQDDIRTYVLTKIVALDPSKLTVTISWSAPDNIIPRNSPTYLDTNPNLVPPAQVAYTNYVTVTVSYQWVPESFLSGPINLTSTSKVAMCY